MLSQLLDKSTHRHADKIHVILRKRDHACDNESKASAFGTCLAE